MRQDSRHLDRDHTDEAEDDGVHTDEGAAGSDHSTRQQQREDGPQEGAGRAVECGVGPLRGGAGRDLFFALQDPHQQVGADRSDARYRPHRLQGGEEQGEAARRGDQRDARARLQQEHGDRGEQTGSTQC
ncbi:hypothetical protein HEMA109418_07905 [Helcobacillus massiliensis]